EARRRRRRGTDGPGHQGRGRRTGIRVGAGVRAACDSRLSEDGAADSARNRWMTARGSSGPAMTARYAPIGAYGVVEHGAGRAAAPGASSVLPRAGAARLQHRGAELHVNIDGDGHGTSTGTGTSSARYSSTRSSPTAIGECELGRDHFVHGRFGE